MGIYASEVIIGPLLRKNSASPYRARLQAGRHILACLDAERDRRDLLRELSRARLDASKLLIQLFELAPFVFTGGDLPLAFGLQLRLQHVRVVDSLLDRLPDHREP